MTEEEFVEYYCTPQFVSSRFTKRAVKAHACAGCGRIIRKGFPYNTVKVKYDGRLETFKNCHVCFYKANPHNAAENRALLEPLIAEIRMRNSMAPTLASSDRQTGLEPEISRSSKK